ncbi:hypothetical protein ABBQ32_000076 [Trebouxia sp. C0010 RCD-2024]
MLQAKCSCHTTSAGARPVLCRSFPSSLKRSVDLAGAQAFRGVAINQQRIPWRSAGPTPALTVCKAAAGTKPAKAAKPAPKSAVAHLRFIRGSPSKVRRVLDQIRGRTYEDALMILEYTPYRACEPIIKTLVSAGANAKENLGLKKIKLVVSECYCNEGPMLKRIKTRAKGRADRIAKLTNHLSIRVQETV